MKKVLVILLILWQKTVFCWDLSCFLTKIKASDAYCAGKFCKAQQNFEQLVVKYPYNTDYLRGLADSFYAQGNFQQACTYYQQALIQALTTDHESIYFNIGCCQAQLYQFKPALETFMKVVELNKQNKRAQKNIEILKKLLEQEKKQQQKQDQSKDNNQGKSPDKQQSSKDNKAKNNETNNNNKQEQGENQSDRDQDNQQWDQQKQNQNGNNQLQQEPKSTSENQEKQNSERASNQQRQQEHTKTSQKTSDKQNTMQPKKSPLDERLLALLNDVDKFDQYGQHLYLQAMAGQHAEQKRSEHDW